MKELPILTELLTIQITKDQYDELVKYYSDNSKVDEIAKLNHNSIAFYNTIIIPLDMYYTWKEHHVDALIADMYDSIVHSDQKFDPNPYDYKSNSCKCDDNGTDELHSCPYQCEIIGNCENVCNCCNSCQNECAMDI